MRSSIFLFLMLLFMSTTMQAQVSDSLLAKADSLYETYQEEEALDTYRQVLERDSTQYTALWRASFLYARVGNRFDDKDNKKEYFNKGIELAEQALKVDSTDTQSNFVMSVAMGRKALISGAKQRVAASREIKKFVDRALEADSSNAGAWHVLGRWHYKVANLSFVERLAANTLFGGIPGDASNEEAASAIERAIELNPDYVLYYYDLARVYEEMGRDEEAIQTCRTALDLENLTPDDPNLKEDCRELIDDLQ